MARILLFQEPMTKRRLRLGIVLVLAAAGCTIGNPSPPDRRTTVEQHSATQAPGSPGTDWASPPIPPPPAPEEGPPLHVD